MQFRIFLQAAIVIGAMGVSSALAAPNCPFNQGAHANAKPNKLYLYFPTTDDYAFPNVDPANPPVPRPTPSSPLHRFDIAELTAYTGTADALRDAIHDVVTDIYCEFNVQVLQTTTAPPNTAARRNTVGIGTDANVVLAPSPCSGRWWTGQSQTMGGDVGDTRLIDYARVWAGTFQTCAGGRRGQLQGSNSTVARWADSIGSTAAHEAGHNYGLAHLDGLPHRDSEDGWSNHLMREGSNTYRWEHRAKRRHFSDNEYSVLAANVGLAMDTMWNWDFTNPNGGTTPNAARLKMELLSVNPALILSWSYSGSLSPWTDPLLTGPTGTRVFKGTTYNVYQIEWSTGQSWPGGPSGEVPNGVKFHIGATFSSVSKTDPDAIIITDVKLLDAANNVLPQHPRWISFDAATFNAGSGLLQLRLSNLLDHPLVLRDVVVRDLPRVMSINAMMADKPIEDLSQRAFLPWANGTRQPLSRRTIAAGEEVSIDIANARKRPYVLWRPTPGDCGPRGEIRNDAPRCQPGIVVVDLFPATTMYITATVVDPKGQRWDPKTKRFVTGPVESRLYYQIAGRHIPLGARLGRR